MHFVDYQSVACLLALWWSCRSSFFLVCLFVVLFVDLVTQVPVPIMGPQLAREILVCCFYCCPALSFYCCPALSFYCCQALFVFLFVSRVARIVVKPWPTRENLPCRLNVSRSLQPTTAWHSGLSKNLLFVALFSILDDIFHWTTIFSSFQVQLFVQCLQQQFKSPIWTLKSK